MSNSRRYCRSGLAKNRTRTISVKKTIKKAEPTLPNPCSDGASYFMSHFSLPAVVRIVAQAVRQPNEPARPQERFVNARKARRAIFLQVHIREAAIIEVHGQMCRAKLVVDKQGTNRSEDDLMFRFEKCIARQYVRKFLALLNSARLTAERAKDSCLRQRLRSPVHREFSVQG